MAEPHLLVVGGWTEIIEKAVAAGYAVSYLGPTAGGGGLDPAVLDRCASVHEVAVDQVTVCLALARRIHAERPLDAVVSFTELGLESAAVIADALGLPGPELWPVAATRYKDWTRRALADSPSLALPWRRVASAADVERFHAEHGPAIIVKPVAGAASMGVRQIRSAEELAEAVATPGWLRDGQYVAEKLVDSDELYSVESLTLRGEHSVISFSYTKLVGYPYSLGSYTMVPPPPGFERVRDEVVRTAREFLTAVGMTWGVAHTEIKVGPDGRPGVIESQTRVGGDRIWLMTERTTGVGQIDLALRGLLDPEVTAPHLPDSTSVGVFFPLLPPAGTVRRVADIAEVRRLPGVLDADTSISQGRVLKEITDNTQRGGHVLLHAPDHDAAYALMREVCRAFWVEFDDGRVWHPGF
ncbi:Biotin carboxylase [Streptoalloteichus tenebrarius]|uniref:Biotin carboxylase n=1 Tax=Streptoalloteichus tenebrarius (strain ATCC 17920 / DSM 40477 / JCM 4838 / CBS 697.72 / NBRC 16177 / NCIMB 11028 / NRRL B-12390 / A12253. 1 / ISP 5477) TaxID=1933 RepID=A0ABT1HQP9_STRSD|nr:ATP-grasp domain-containing protein [Streptoalloteichus tenebrarius]MCP2257838.1 Biotin carboxylase [Streptoalloteichus tenebrarius]BFE99800.1 ATP-grasp domain-containing protein [Streptoalloteichus tenebrarius]